MKRMKKTILILLLFVFVVLVPGLSYSRSERFYQNVWCKQHDGETEVVLSDRTRCDCLTSTHAVEVDFARKWKEAIRQSLHYSRQTGKRAGIVLILETPKDRKYWDRLKSEIRRRRLSITTWCIGAGCP